MNEEPYKLCDEKLYKLYALETENQKYYLSEHQKRVSFYIGLISALFSVTVVGVIKSEQWYDCLVLILGPITIYIVSGVAKKSADRFYMSFLESISTIKKIELDLGLQKKRNTKDKGKNWVAKECYVPKRHIESTLYDSSKTWAEKHMRYSENSKRNYNGVVELLFRATKVLAVVLLVMIIKISHLKYF